MSRIQLILELEAHIARARTLRRDARLYCQEIDQLLAARKDAVAAARNPDTNSFITQTASPDAGSINHSRLLPCVEPERWLLPNSPADVLLVVEPNTEDYLLLRRALSMASVPNQVLWAKNGNQ